MREQDGFTLIEVLVSFVILSGAIILSLESYANGLRNLHHAQEILDAQELARSVLARWQSGDEVIAKGGKGQTGPFAWQLTVQNPGFESKGQMQPELIEVKVFNRKVNTNPVASLLTIDFARRATP
jgi:prepilin-type N-terminal cleavage/methylation domain-containing protein